MTRILPKQNIDILLAKEENLLNWNEILGKFKTTFGNDKEPLAGDVFTLDEYGNDRHAGRGGKSFEITDVTFSIKKSFCLRSKSLNIAGKPPSILILCLYIR